MNRCEFAERLGGSGNRLTNAVVVEERDPTRWRQSFISAVGGQGPVFLSNPDWGSWERAEFDALVKQSADGWDPEIGWLMIPTGGSSGSVKLARHDHSTLVAAVRGYQTFFAEPVVSTLGVLPLHHVGGLMGWLRSALTEGQYVDADWRKIKSGEGERPAGEGMTISLVPTQLKALLEQEEGADWLRAFSRVLVGGAVLPETLAEQATQAGVNLVRSYGSTETAAMVAADKLCAGTCVGLEVLPHAVIGFDDNGQVEVRGESVSRGYWPDSLESSQIWRSDDFGRRLIGGQIVIEGRLDDMITTGGEKVNPREVEQVLRSLIGDDRVVVVGVPDATWGQRVVAVHHPDVPLNLGKLKSLGILQIASYKWPKQAVGCDPWPVNAVGKLDRSKLLAAIEEHLPGQGRRNVNEDRRS